jgi:uncharacterized repeat protein (TIGR03803 family)
MQNLVCNTISLRRSVCAVFLLAAAATSVFPAGAAEKTLYAFKPLPAPGEPQTGAYPLGTLLRDANGALYGATWLDGPYGSGTIFKLSPPAAGQTEWSLSVIYAFTGGLDGDGPNPVRAMDSRGAIYGTTSYGGTALDGVAFKLTPPEPGSTQWRETVLHNFNYNFAYKIDDGAHPSGGLIIDRTGALYGSTDLGGITPIQAGSVLVRSSS